MADAIAGDAISLVWPYTYMAKATTRLAVMDPWMCNKSIFLERKFRYFLLSEFTRQKQSSGTLSNRCFFETAEVVADDGEATEIVDVVADNGFIPFKRL